MECGGSTWHSILTSAFERDDYFQSLRDVIPRHDISAATFDTTFHNRPPQPCTAAATRTIWFQAKKRIKEFVEVSGGKSVAVVGADDLNFLALALSRNRDDSAHIPNGISNNISQIPR